MQEIREHIVRMATENSSWGYCRIQGALKNLGHQVAPSSRAVHIAGSTPNPHGSFMNQIARNLTDSVDGFLLGKRFVLLDRDSKFTKNFKRILEDSGVKVILTTFQAPNANAVAERFVLSIKTECLDKMILFGSRSLERSLREYSAHDLTERSHRALDNELLHRAPSAREGEVEVRERLGGLLEFYSRAA